MDRTKNREVTKVVPLEIRINSHKKQLKAAVTVTDLNSQSQLKEWNYQIYKISRKLQDEALGY